LHCSLKSLVAPRSVLSILSPVLDGSVDITIED
jgi:hypothetical protein